MAPFRQMMLDPKGAAYPCCYHYGYKLGNLRQKSLVQIWDGDKLARLRHEFTSGEIKTCRGRIRSGCYEDFEHLRGDGPVTPSLRRLDLRLGGKCNLRCRMCEIWTQENGVYDTTSFWEDGPKDIFPYLEDVDLLGGEPFIQEDTYRLVEAVTRVNSRCRFSFVTNGHYDYDKRVRGLLRGLPLGRIQLSLDTLDPARYAKIRLGGRLRRPLQTLEGLLETRSENDFELVISMCVMTPNWREVPDFIDFCRTKGARPELQFAHYDPSRDLTLLKAPSAERREIADWLRLSVRPEDAHFLTPVLVGLEG